MLDISSRFAWPNRQVAFSTAAILKAYRSFAQAGEPAATSATMAGLNEMLVESKKLRSVPRRPWANVCRRSFERPQPYLAGLGLQAALVVADADIATRVGSRPSHRAFLVALT
jgi:hypothetical protein